MNKPEEQFEPLRQEYLNEKFPGDLAKLVEVGSSSVDEQLDNPKVGQSAAGSRKVPRIGWAIAALLFIGVTLGTLWWSQNRGGDSIAKLDSPTTEAKSKPRRATGFFQPSRLGSVRLMSTPSRTRQRSRLLSSSTFSQSQRKTGRTSFWRSGRPALAQNQSSSSDNSPQKKRTSKPGQRRSRFRNLFRFEPIQYRRS